MENYFSYLECYTVLWENNQIWSLHLKNAQKNSNSFPSPVLQKKSPPFSRNLCLWRGRLWTFGKSLFTLESPRGEMQLEKLHSDSRKSFPKRTQEAIRVKSLSKLRHKKSLFCQICRKAPFPGRRKGENVFSSPLYSCGRISPLEIWHNFWLLLQCLKLRTRKRLLLAPFVCKIFLLKGGSHSAIYWGQRVNVLLFCQFIPLSEIEKEGTKGEKTNLRWESIAFSSKMSNILIPNFSFSFFSITVEVSRVWTLA